MVNAKTRTYLIIKRIFDIFLSIFALIILSPLLIIIAIVIKIDSKGPVLFKQKRIGRYKRKFDILKFRTMKIDSPKNTPTHLLENPTHWITRIGRFLRKTSLDELPQLINILKGDMSIIGPRPALWNQFDLILERDKYNVHILYPGLTGYAQVNGRDELSIIDKARLDGDYIKNICLFLDIKIFAKTILKVFSSQGVLEGGTSIIESKGKKK